MSTSLVRRSALPFLVALVVLAVVVGVIRLVDPPGSGAGGSGSVGSGGSGSGGDAGTSDGQPVLRLVGWAAPEPGREPDPRYRLDTALGDDAWTGAGRGAGDSSSAVRLLRGSGAAADVSDLVSALALPGDGTTRDGARQWVDGGRVLTVRDDGGWDYIGTPLLADGDAEAVPGVAVPAEAVLTALGRDPARERFQGEGPDGYWTVEPEVDGLPTSGYATTVVVSGGTVTSAQGWLGETEPATAYPTISARAAWDALVHTSLPMPLMACPEPAPGTDSRLDPVMCGGDITVTGAREGRSLQQTSRGPALVPAWLFAVAGSPSVLAQVAVDPAYVVAADGGSSGGDDGTSSSGGGSSGSSGSGSVGGPVGTVTAEPVDPGPDQPQSRFTTVTRAGDDGSIDVTFWGGVEECFDFTVTAVETDRLVTLSLREESRGQQVCIDLAQEHTRTVDLQEPLGIRRVVDATTGETLLGPTR